MSIINNQLQIINEIRKVEAGSMPDIDILDVLKTHNCFFWLKAAYPCYAADIISLNKLIAWTQFHECAPIFREMKYIPYAVIKGAVLSQVAYSDVALRRSSDIDLLISRTHLDDVKKILLRHGFMQGRITKKGIIPFSREELIFQSITTHQIAPFVKKTKNPILPFITVDINLDIFWGESGCRTDMNSFLEHSMEITICGIFIKKLTPIYDFISLCMHHYKDMNSLYLISRRGLRLDQFCDILHFVKNVKLDMSILLEVAQKYQVTEYLYFCIYYANTLCPNPLLEEYLQTFGSAISIDLTNFYGLNSFERRPWNIPFEERLLSPEFSKDFFLNLTTEQKEKVCINYEYM